MKTAIKVVVAIVLVMVLMKFGGFMNGRNDVFANNANASSAAGYESPEIQTDLPSCESEIARKMMDNYLSQRDERLQDLHVEAVGMDIEAVLEAIGYHIKKVRCKGHMTLTNGKDYAVSYLFWFSGGHPGGRVRALIDCHGCRRQVAQPESASRQ